MTSISVLPIILLLVFIGVLFLFSKFIERINNRGKNVKRMLLSYVMILVLATAVYFLLPLDKSIVSDESIDPDTAPSLFHHLNLETLDEVDSSLIRKSWEFDINSDKLQVHFTENDWGSNVPIYLDQVEDLDEKVEAIFYQSPTFVEGVNVADFTALPDIDFSSNTLRIREPAYEDLEFITFKTEFPVRQFTGEKLIEEGFFHGDELIYIRVPEGIDLDIDEEINFVD
ncbi:hypothetical protein [Oceanobacillus halophilus]|uniref:Uncharacterized protein n=1 Tax=Oceanobacillus halophilus TaxID=930130 RepID=A0A495A1D5_9BACI|nr:hypothetical protein [Oceanobacillus halophilus]RKQ33279.1 hypothetical protein D8M06_10940 [Oceanobacillus halophilus]